MEKDTQVPQSSVPSDPTNVVDEAVNEEPSMQLKELMDFCTKLQQRVLDLENTKTDQAQEITSLKLRVKKLEKKGGSRTQKLRRLYKVGRSARIVSSDEASLVPVKEVSVVGNVNTASIATTVSAATITEDEITLAQTLVELKSVKHKVTTATTETTKGILLQEPSESITTITTIPSKDNGKGIMAKIKTDYELAQRLQVEEQEKLTVDEKATLFQQLLEKRRKHFAAKRAEEKRNKPPTRAPQRSIMCTYLKNMAGWKPKDLKNKSFANIQELFDKAFKRVNTFVDFRIKLVEGTKMEESSKKADVMEESSKKAEIAQESSSKRARGELEQENAKKQKVDNDQEATKMKELMKIVPDEEGVAVDAIPLATKPPSIVDWKIVKEGKISYYQIIRADRSSKRPEEGYEIVLWGDLKTMFEHHVEDAMWRNLRENKVLVWKLFDSCGVHFVRFQSLNVFMLVEKRYPLTPATITDMLNKKLQTDHWNEMCYQLLKLITKQLKNQ
ncbi:hypothetical protein Tco_0276672 [Tanacetum coccineum]